MLCGKAVLKFFGKLTEKKAVVKSYFSKVEGLPEAAI